MEKLRGCKVVGLERILDGSEQIGEFIQDIRDRGIRLPKVLQFRRMGCCGRGAYDNSHSSIRLDMSSEHTKYVILHELVHNHRVRGHTKRFWRKFITFCVRMSLDPGVYFGKYCYFGRGKSYWKSRVRRMEGCDAT